MYKVLLRDVVTGEKHWYDKCYLNGTMEKNKIILWSPNGEAKRRFKILAWKWEGVDKYRKHDKGVNDFAAQALLDLDIPREWREELMAWQNGRS